MAGGQVRNDRSETMGEVSMHTKVMNHNYRQKRKERGTRHATKP